MRKALLIFVVMALAGCGNLFPTRRGTVAVGTDGHASGALVSDAPGELGSGPDAATEGSGTAADGLPWDIALPPACAPGCDDGNPCTDDACDLANGCTHTNNTAPCNAGGFCTADACKGGACVAGPARLFSASYGGSDRQAANAVSVLADGGLAFAGNTASCGSVGVRFWLGRTDAGGKLQWSQTYGGGSCCEEVTAIAVLADGGLALAGDTHTADLPGGQKNAGWTDFWLVRTDAGGKLLWSQNYGGSGYEFAHAIAALADGGFALAGSTSSAEFLGGQKGVTEAWLVRTNADGNELWSHTFGGTGWDSANAMATLADGGMALAGRTKSTDLPGGSKQLDDTDFWLVRTNAGGTLLWSQAYGGSDVEEATAMTVLADGGFALAGSTNSTDLPGGQKSAGWRDLWLVRTDAGGKLLWSQTYGGSGWDFAWSMTALPDGGLAVAGSTSSTDLPGGQKSAGYDDAWLVRTDAAGKLLWNRTYGSSQDDYASAVITLPDGGLALAGRMHSTYLPCGGKSSYAGANAWLLRTDPWGHISCAEAGPCASKTLADCDDAKPCTADLCDGKTGCTHTNLADGSNCGGGKTCAAGVCL